MSEEILTCSNCGYETDEVHKETELCQTCKNAYDLGWQEGKSKCVCTDQPPYKECLEHFGY